MHQTHGPWCMCLPLHASMAQGFGYLSVDYIPHLAHQWQPVHTWQRRLKSTSHSTSWTAQSCSLCASKVGPSSWVKGLEAVTLLPSWPPRAHISLAWDLKLLSEYWSHTISILFASCCCCPMYGSKTFEAWSPNDLRPLGFSMFTSTGPSMMVTSVDGLDVELPSVYDFRHVMRADFLPWRNYLYDDKEHGNGWFPCLKKLLRLLSPFCPEIYSREKREASFFSMMISPITLVVDFCCGSLNGYTLFLGRGSEIAFNWFVGLSSMNSMYCSWPRAWIVATQSAEDLSMISPVYSRMRPLLLVKWIFQVFHHMHKVRIMPLEALTVFQCLLMMSGLRCCWPCTHDGWFKFLNNS